MIFPLASIPVSIVIGGAPIRSYNRPYIREGRVMAPIVPFVTRCSDGISYEGKVIVIRRGARVAHLLTGVLEPATLQAYYVAITPVLTEVGAHLHYDAGTRTLFVRCAPRLPIRTPAPYESSGPSVMPTTVFTAEPVVTPRPSFSGSPHPRRTPIVITTPRA